MRDKRALQLPPLRRTSAQSNRSFGTPSLVHKQTKEAPILYLTGSREYNRGALIDDGITLCTEASLWKEITSQPSIKSVLKQWRERVYNDDESTPPFRTVLHRTNKMKFISRQVNGGGTGASQCTYFALLWIPSNTEDGINADEFMKLIDAMREAKYFVNKLNKECIYISGPEYGNLEEYGSIDGSDQKFDLGSLASLCRSFFEVPDHIDIEIEVAVHEIAREKYCTGETDNEETSYGRNSNDRHTHSVLSQMKQKGLFSAHQLGSKRRMSFSGVSDSQFQIQPQSHESYDEIYSEKTELSQEYHVFAFVWFKVKTLGSYTVQNASDQSDNNKATGLRASFLDDNNDEKEDKKHSVHRKSSTKYHDGVLPALSVMNKLHQQPYVKSRVYNIEIMGYDECYENLDLVVNRTFYRTDAFLVILQALFLPLFILIPPIVWRRCCTKSPRPRYRPVGSSVPLFDDLDRTEQVPWDITRLWKNFDAIKGPTRRAQEWLFRLVSFIIGSIVWSTVMYGPRLYRIETRKHGHEARYLLFFDCFGPLFFYCLGAFTVMWWSCSSRVLVGPQEHLLLYNKLVVYRPSRKTAPNYNKIRTDWAVLTNLSHPTLLTTFSFAYRKGFLELRSPKHELLSLRRFNCKKRPFKTICSIYLRYFVCVALYFNAQNLENWEKWKRPCYISDDAPQYMFRQVYCILSNILSCIFLVMFIIEWGTMIDRMSRQHDNVQTLSQLIIRNTYSEYIEFDYIDNILSWLAMEHFVKRKGMMLFSSLETSLISLILLSIISWGCTFNCITNGIGLRLSNDNSLFSNSALATWVYLAVLSMGQVARMLQFGRKFNREADKQDGAIKSQCGTIQANIYNLMHFLKKDKVSLELKFAIKTSQVLLQHINHEEVVPKVFGIQFDKLTAKAAWGAIFATLPTLVAFVAKKAAQNDS
eukprot:188592_1